jgi:predicted regulator of amino acid metabolism with ACT domain
VEFNTILNKARDLAGPANETISRLLDEFNAALPQIEALGFTVEGIQVTMGLLPEVSAKLIAAAAKVNVQILDEMINKKSEQKTLVTVLKALQTAYNVRDQLGDLGLGGIEIDLTLGLPPKISIGFLKGAAAATPPAVVTASA